MKIKGFFIWVPYPSQIGFGVIALWRKENRVPGEKPLE